MNAKRTLAASAATLFLAAAIVAPGLGRAAAPDAGTTTSQDGTTERVAVPTPNKSWEAWAQDYPDQVNSFFDGADEVEQDGKVHSHSLLYATVPFSGASGRQPGYIATFGSACISCKSTTGTRLYEQMGLEAFSLPWDEVEAQVDWWDCGLCHEDGVPGGELRYGGMAATAFGGTLLDSVDADEAVCGQCHNFYGAVYARGGLMEKMQSGEVDYDTVDPYRYGTDPDSLMRAALEDGYEMSVDPATGIASFQANHPEVEIYQGSVHQQLGLGCTSCHMPQKENADGEAYTSHNASSTPLENEEALEYCLTCHVEQGVEDTEAMKQYILDAQAEVADMETAFYEKQGALQTLIADATAAGTMDEELLQQARDNYTRATWYVRYADGGSEIRGQKVAHNPAGIRSYIEQADQLLDEAIALF